MCGSTERDGEAIPRSRTQMSMYLSNDEVGPVGAEPGEFIDYPLTTAELAYRGVDATPPDSTPSPPGTATSPSP
jgi:hypothetical protein